MHSGCTDLNMEWKDFNPEAPKSFKKLSTKQALPACTTLFWNQAPVRGPAADHPFDQFSILCTDCCHSNHFLNSCTGLKLRAR